MVMILETMKLETYIFENVKNENFRICNLDHYLFMGFPRLVNS